MILCSVVSSCPNYVQSDSKFQSYLTVLNYRIFPARLSSEGQLEIDPSNSQAKTNRPRLHNIVPAQYRTIFKTVNQLP